MVCFLVKNRNRNLGVLADLNTAVPSEQSIGPFTVPQVFEGEGDMADEDDDSDNKEHVEVLLIPLVAGGHTF